MIIRRIISNRLNKPKKEPVISAYQIITEGILRKDGVKLPVPGLFGIPESIRKKVLPIAFPAVRGIDKKPEQGKRLIFRLPEEETCRNRALLLFMYNAQRKIRISASGIQKAE